MHSFADAVALRLITAFVPFQNITIADLAHLPLGALIGKIGVKLLEDPMKRPNVSRYLAIPM